MTYFEWSTDLETGHETIDDQHRHLFEIANRLQEAALADESDAETVADTIYELTDYVIQHFNDEEGLMAEKGYPGLSAHIALHEHLTAETMMLTARYFNGEELAATKIAPFLADWLTNHIRAEDMRLIAFMHTS